MRVNRNQHVFKSTKKRLSVKMLHI